MPLLGFDFKIDKNNFEIHFKKPNDNLGNWHEECLKTAQYIKDCAAKPLAVAYSGGIDSEVVCRSFLALNIPFTPFIFDFGSNYNDISYAFKFCEQFSLKPKIIKFDLSTFLHEKIPEYIHLGYMAPHLFRYAQLFYLEHFEEMGYCGVLGGGEQIYLQRNNQVCIKYERGMLNCIEWINQKNSIHFPYFFQTTPNIIASYLSDKLIRMMLEDANYFDEVDIMYSTEKILVYHYYWKNIEKRPKQNGYEDVVKFTAPVNRLLRERFYTEPLYIPIRIIKKQMGINF